MRWAAVTFRETEKHYRRITGYEHLWMLKAHLDCRGTRKAVGSVLRNRTIPKAGINRVLTGRGGIETRQNPTWTWRIR